MSSRNLVRIFKTLPSVLLITLMMSSSMLFAFFGFNVKRASAQATYAPLLLGALAEHANWLYRNEGELAGQYAAGTKHLAYLGASLLDIGGVEAYIDLDDYYSAMHKDQAITLEGKNDWITVWLDVGASFGGGLPVAMGLAEVPMVGAEKDPGREWGLHGPSACPGIFSVKTMEWTSEGKEWGQGASFDCLGFNVSLISLSVNVLRFEIQKSTLDNYIETSLTAAGAFEGGTINQQIGIDFAFELISRLFDFDGYKPSLVLPDPADWRHFTSTDDNGVRPEVAAYIDYAWGGIDMNGDSLPDNVFPCSPTTLGLPTAYFSFDVNGWTLGNNAADYAVSVLDVPSESGWLIGAKDGTGSGLDISPLIDRTFNLADVPPVDSVNPDQNYWETNWMVGCSDTAVDSITVDFQLKHDKLGPFDTILDTVTVTFTKGGSLPGGLPQIDHTPITESKAGDPINVQATITDDIAIKESWLWYLPDSTNDYVDIQMTPLGGDIFEATIPGAVVAEGTLKYYLAATNGLATVLSPEAGTHSVSINAPDPPLSLSNSTLNPPSGRSSLTENWNFGVTYTSPGNTSPAYVRLKLSGTNYPEAVYDMPQENPGDTTYSDGAMFSYVHAPLGAGTYTYFIEASDGNTLDEIGPLTMQVVAPQGARVNVVPNPSSIPLDGASQSLVTATVLTDDDKPLQNAQVTFGCTGVTCSFFQVDDGEMWHRVNTDSDGQAQIYLQPRSSGTGAVTATLDNEVSGSETIEVTGSNDVGLRIRFLRDGDLSYTMHIDAVYLANGDPIQFEDVTISTSRGTLTAVGNASITGSSITIKTNSSDGGSYVGAVRARLEIPSEGETTITATLRSVSEAVTSYLGGEPAWIRPFLHLPEDRAADWSADGNKIAIGGSDYLVHVYDTTTWNQLIQWRPEGGSANTVYDLSFAPDRDEIAVASRYTTRERVSDGFKIWESSMNGTRHVDWSPDGSWIAGGSRDQTQVYTISGSLAQSISHTDDWIRSLAFSPDGEYLLMGHDSGRVRIVRTSNWSTISDFYSDPDGDTNDEVYAADWSPDSSKYVISTAELGLLLFNRTANSPYASYTGHGIPSGVDALAWCPISDSSNPGYGKIASSAGDSLHVWIADTQQPLLEAPNSGANRALAWSPDCELLVFPAGVVAPWDTVGPDIEVSSHYNGQVVETDPISLEGNIQDPFFVDVATYSLNGGPATDLTLDGSGNFALSMDLAAGDNTITLNAEDGTGNPSSMELVITLLADLNAPQISLPQGASPGPLLHEICDLTTIASSISDPWVGVDPATVSAVIQHPDGVDVANFRLYDDGVQGGDPTASDGIFTGQWDSCPAVESGFYYVDVIASDNDGNTAYADNLILLDYYDLPTISQNSHSPLSPLDSDSVLIETLVSDPSGISQVVLQYSSDGGSTYTPVNMIYNDGTGKYEGTIPPHDMGQIDYRISAQDVGGHEASTGVFSYTISDGTPPSFDVWGQGTEDLLANWSSTFQVQVQVSDAGGSGLVGMTPQLRYKRGGYDADYSVYADMTSSGGGSLGFGTSLDGEGTWTFDIPMPLGGWEVIENESVTWEVQLSDVAGNPITSEEIGEFVDDDDSYGPVVTLSTSTRFVDTGETLIVTASISDSTKGNHGVTYARLSYGYVFPYESFSVDGVGPGGNGDGEWTFTIPAQDLVHLGEVFKFYIIANDGDDTPAVRYATAAGQYFSVVVMGEQKFYLPVLIQGN